jgi:ADP-ribose pyrophosphatase
MESFNSGILTVDVKTKPVYQGKVVDLNIETVRLPNGHDCELEIVRHPGGVAVVAIDARDRICLLRQFRHAAGGWIWEIPAGRLEPGEHPLHSAQRELQEETGTRADDWQSLGPIFSSPGVFTEVIHLFFCRYLHPVAPTPEDHEVFEVHWIEYPRVRTMIDNGDIKDAKTLVGLCLAQPFLSA